MHRICGWLAQEIGDRSPEGSQFAIWSGRGGLDQVAAVDAGLPVSTVADLAAVSGDVTVATSADDGVNLIGLAVHKALRLAGVDTGGLSFRYDERPFPPISWFADGEADVLIHEAI